MKSGEQLRSARLAMDALQTKSFALKTARHEFLHVQDYWESYQDPRFANMSSNYKEWRAYSKVNLKGPIYSAREFRYTAAALETHGTVLGDAYWRSYPLRLVLNLFDPFYFQGL